MARRDISGAANNPPTRFWQTVWLHHSREWAKSSRLSVQCRFLLRPCADYGTLSLPHVGHAAIAGCLIDEDFEYRQWGLLDRTHVRFFGIKNVQNL